MNCPKCGCDTFVIDTRSRGQAVKRRRRCQGCGHRFTTYEISKDFYKQIIEGGTGDEEYQR